jgi:excisionase family DNA binding protein
MEPLLLKPMDVAEHLGISKSKVYELLASGALPSIRIGKSIRVPTEELRKWVATRMQSHADSPHDHRKGEAATKPWV